MKAIINGKRYDTQAAEVVAEENLYHTARGNWFLASPKSGVGQITPLTEEEAKEWLDRARAWDKLEQYFADQIEDA